MACPTMLFHSVHGENISLLENGRRALRKQSFEKSVVFSDRALRPHERFTVSIERTESGWTGHLRIGLRQGDPASPSGADDAATWLVPLLPWTASTASRLPTDVGSRVGVYFEPIENGSQARLHILIEDADICPEQLGPISLTAGPLYAVIDVFGITKEIRVAESTRTPDSLNALCLRQVHHLVDQGRCPLSRIPCNVRPFFVI